MWGYLCALPQRDQDFDGLGDICDDCPDNFDPHNYPYIDASGKLWATQGFCCNGEYGIGETCPDDDQGESDDDGTSEKSTD